jgi:hypothetical protein
MLGPDGKVVQVDLEPMLRRHRVSCVKTRADAIGEVADLAASPAFDLDEVCASGEARIGEPAVDAALGVVWELIQVEQLRQLSLILRTEPFQQLLAVLFHLTPGNCR